MVYTFAGKFHSVYDRVTDSLSVCVDCDFSGVQLLVEQSSLRIESVLLFVFDCCCDFACTCGRFATAIAMSQTIQY